ncbi:MAG: hypothetical protein M3121_06685 [Chloroflexota bacterium]|nr:hypothetical protein [Chloroflexota bacterium]
MATPQNAKTQHEKIEEQTDKSDAYVDAIVARLTTHFLTSAPLPGKEDISLTADRFYRFYRHVVAEGYGQG